MKVVNTSDKSQPISLDFAGLKKNNKLINGTCITFNAPNTDLENTIDQPYAIIPQEKNVAIDNNKFITDIASHTFAIYKFTKQ